MPDYYCWPLWEASPGKIGNIDPDDLEISADLKVRLAKWAKEYDGILVLDDPRLSGFKTREAEEQFRRDGLKLAEDLQSELGNEFEIILGPTT
jgi:hypothetical protein